MSRSNRMGGLRKANVSNTDSQTVTEEDTVLTQEVEDDVTDETGVDISEYTSTEAHLSGWEDAGDGTLRNLRDFVTTDGAVPQGVVRPFQEAIDLEAKRVG